MMSGACCTSARNRSSSTSPPRRRVRGCNGVTSFRCPLYEKDRPARDAMPSSCRGIAPPLLELVRVGGKVLEEQTVEVSRRLLRNPMPDALEDLEAVRP